MRQPFHALARERAGGQERLLITDARGVLLGVYDARDGRPLPHGDDRMAVAGRLAAPVHGATAE